MESIGTTTTGNGVRERRQGRVNMDSFQDEKHKNEWKKFNNKIFMSVMLGE